MGRRSRKRRATAPGSGGAGSRRTEPTTAASAKPTAAQEPAPAARAPDGAEAGAGGRSLRSPRRRTAEERNAQVRAALAPLAPGERPPAVTVAAIVAGTLALANLAAYAAGLEIDGERPALTGILVYEALLIAAALGMWRAKYWAVLGFQFMLGFLLVILGLLLMRASNWLGVVVVLAIGIPAAWLFWKLVRALARIQMPEPPRSRR